MLLHVTNRCKIIILPSRNCLVCYYTSTNNCANLQQMHVQTNHYSSPSLKHERMHFHNSYFYEVRSLASSSTPNLEDLTPKLEGSTHNLLDRVLSEVYPLTRPV
ncbi:hypothetical protein NP493_283g06015 [Ridgeia piscesae]|uniref:Uncharacterized protein n=1 Tax=Ridgeia piscesae TaxID=27915 RepID=A0AAD9NX51_RIDPI|nr:hypothetical protein NP493_283g06015 [Ridgeia piscesae]